MTVRNSSGRPKKALRGNLTLLSCALILATAWAAPATNMSAETRNDRVALGSVRVIVTCLVAYQHQHGEFPGTLAGILNTGNEKIARFCEDSELASGVKQGYEFLYVSQPSNQEEKLESFTIAARPLEYGKTGKISFFSSQAGIIRWTKEDRVPSAEDPPLDSLSFD